LIAAAEALENGEDPFSGGFLSEHEVTSGECINLARQCAIGARIVARGLDDPRSAEGIATLTAMVSA
jgi:hypothetical protein